MFQPYDGLYVFVVDTNLYAGSFERELTAFCTGQIGECGVGAEYADVFKKECPDRVRPFSRIVSQVPDEHGCHRPTSIWTTPGYWNDGIGNEWKDEAWGTPEMIQKFRESVKEYQLKYPGSLKHLTEESVPVRHPAYQSVAMFFHKQPSEEELGFLIARAKTYRPLDRFDPSFDILGFRLVEMHTTEVTLWNAPSTT